MSAYKYFFIKSNTNEFIPISEFSRNTEVYRYCSAPYETIEEIKNWYYRQYNKLDGDEFTICKNIDEVHDFEQLIKRSK